VRTSDVGGRTMRNVEPAHRGQGPEASLGRIADEREGGSYSDRIEVVDLIPAQLSWLPVSGTRLIPR